MPRRPAPTVPLALVVVLAALASPARADDAAEARSTTHYTLRAELGPELDTNALRTETVDRPGAVNDAPVVSPLARGVIAGSISDVLGDGHQVALSATIGAKFFANPEARSENVAVVDGAALWRKAFGAGWSGAGTVGYYDAFQRDAPPPYYSSERRDFRSVTPTLRLSRALGENVDAGVGAGYRLFTFKPDHSYDFQAPTAVLDARWARETADGTADWEVALRAGYERRLFAGRQFVDTRGMCTTPEACPPTTGPELRRDHFSTTALDISRTGRLLIGAGYGLHVNLSNSFGESVMRHIVTARFAAALPFDLYLAARLEILIANYADPIFAATGAMTGLTYVSIEDENRNSARVELSRNMSDRLQLIARYTFYANELRTDNDVSYRRQTALLSLSFSLEK